MNNEQLIAPYRANQAIVIEKFIKKLNNPFVFKLFMLIKLPMAFIAGLKVKTVSEQVCEITVPYKWLNQNPFRSTYFAVLAMAAEMASGMIALMYTQDSKPSVAMLVTKIEASFVKKATGLTTFTFDQGDAVKKAIETAITSGEGQTITCQSVGRNKAGEVEAIFDVTWSFKARL